MLAEAGKVVSVTCGLTALLRDFCKPASGAEFRPPTPPAFAQRGMVTSFLRHYLVVSPPILWGMQARFSHPHLAREWTEAPEVEQTAQGHGQLGL